MSQVINLPHAFADHSAAVYQYPNLNKEPIEKELKELTEDGSPEALDMFIDDCKNGLVEGIDVLHSADSRIIITRQIDTPEGKLREQGIFLRIRGTYTKDGHFVNPDISLKLPHYGEVGVSRYEFETAISDPSIIDIAALERKFEEELKQGRLPQLRMALNIIKGVINELGEVFLLPVSRDTHIFGLDTSAIGYDDDKKFYGETVRDLINVVVRTPKGSFLVPMQEGSSELEVEPLDKICRYNSYPGNDRHICKNLDGMDEDLALLFIKDALAPYGERANTVVKSTTLSKSERGFQAVDKYRDLVASSAKTMNIKDTFMANAVGLVQVKTPPLLSRLSDINVPYALRAA